METVSGSSNAVVEADGAPAQRTLALRAMALYSDGSESDVTAQATWASESETVATVTAGEVRAVRPGGSRVSASYLGVAGSVNVTVVGTPLPDLVLAAGGYILDTDAGTLTDGAVTLEGWDPDSKSLLLQSLTIESGATLRIVGTLPFKAWARNDITVTGVIDFSGQNGARGADGDAGANGNNGLAGQSGGDIDLLARGRLAVCSAVEATAGLLSPVTAVLPVAAALEGREALAETGVTQLSSVATQDR